MQIQPRPADRSFWGELTPCEHLVQFYDDDSAILDSLAAFAVDGLERGDAVVIIATKGHRGRLENRLWAQGVDVGAVRSRDQYIDLDAEETLARFMVNGWPDEERFNAVVAALLSRASGPGRRRVRAFGEMVVLLWAQGHNGATVRLEHLWQGLCQSEAFSLFCAYPKVGFTKDMSDGMRDICAAHSRVIGE